MSVRYLSNLAVALAASFLVVATQAFPLSTVKWLTFAIAIGVTVVSAGTGAARLPLAQSAISALGVGIGAWTIVASLVFSLHAVMWLGFASAVALVGLAVLGLTIYELSTERVVHSIQVEQQPGGKREPRAASGERLAA
jgi:hypothetical protein